MKARVKVLPVYFVILSQTCTRLFFHLLIKEVLSHRLFVSFLNPYTKSHKISECKRLQHALKRQADIIAAFKWQQVRILVTLSASLIKDIRVFFRPHSVKLANLKKAMFEPLPFQASFTYTFPFNLAAYKRKFYTNNWTTFSLNTI